jgi:hypothetical protein
MCGCPAGTIKSRVNRAGTELAQLSVIKGPEDFEEDPIVSAVIADGDRAVIGIAMMPKRDNFKFQGGATTNTEGEQGSQGRKNRDHVHDGMATQKSLGFLRDSEF